MTDIEVINALVDVNDNGNWFCSDGAMDYYDIYVGKSYVSRRKEILSYSVSICDGGLQRKK